MNHPRRVLVSAYACEPDRGSDPGVGWNQVQQIARFNEVSVITRSNNAPAIRRAGAHPRVHWVFHDLPRWMRWWKRGQRGVHLYYYIWQIGAWRLAKRLHGRIGFDLAHHVTFVNYWMPSFLFLLPVPFIWGPVGGGESTPRGLRRTYSARGRLFEAARACARWMGEHDPAVRACARRARVVLSTTGETAARLARLGSRRIQIAGESGISAEELDRMGRSPPGVAGPADGAPRLLSAGRLVHLKGYHLALRAFARVRLRFPGSQYRLIGSGPEKRRLAALARQLGVSDAVLFPGRMPRADLLSSLAGCDVFLHPSLHDSGGWACPEAMAAGRPVICIDTGGPAAQVTPECGIRVIPGSEEQTVAGLAAGLERLLSDPDLRVRMGAAARDRAARVFAWSVKGDLLRGVYARAVEEEQSWRG